MSDFPSPYEWALLDQWLTKVLETDREHEARIVLALLEPLRPETEQEDDV